LTVSKDQFTVIIPTLNEEEAIGFVLEELKQYGYNNILVIDGYSTDKTVQIARNNGVRVEFQHGRGKTGVLKTAIEHVETPYILMMDGDATYDPACIERLLAYADRYDQVIGYRVEGRSNIPRLHRLGNWVITKVFNILMDTRLSDVCSGMWIIKMETARQLELDSSGFALEVEVISQTRENITEVPIKYRSRIGKKKLGTWRDGVKIVMSIVSLARINNPVFFFSALASLSIIPALIILGWVAIEVLLAGVWHDILALLGLVLLLFASQAFTVSTMSILLKKMERRFLRSLTKR